jgi:5'-methylthioadenosine phosphorylase
MSATAVAGTPILGVIGGSGLYGMRDAPVVETYDVTTPYGKPSAPVVRVRFQRDGKEADCLFLPRHGIGHSVSPSDVDYRANVCAMKMLGVTHLVGVSAVGSMREEIAPGDFVVVDQYIDLTKRRIGTFFERGIAGHVAFADPVCSILARSLFNAAALAVSDADVAPRPTIHDGGTYVCIEGPQFSTRAESRLYRSWGVSVIGMTAMPEAKLAREAAMPYATLALATDYDCWHSSEEDVTVEQVVATLKRNARYAALAVKHLTFDLPDAAKSLARRAQDGAVMTAPERIPQDVKKRLEWLLP